MTEAQEKALSGSALLQQLMTNVNGVNYTPEARIWNNANSNMRLMLWNLANLNQLENNTSFKRDWLKLPNHLKAELRGAIHELHRFVKQADLCLSGGEHV